MWLRKFVATFLFCCHEVQRLVLVKFFENTVWQPKITIVFWLCMPHDNSVAVAMLLVHLGYKLQGMPEDVGV